MNYITTTRRRVASADRLNMISQYYTDKQNLERRSSYSLANLLEEGCDDYKYRNICYDCASQIYYAYLEGSYLAGFSLNYDNKGYRWISPANISLLSYAPADNVSDSSGNVYNGYINDVQGCWSMFRSFGGRDQTLRNWRDVFDDDYCHQRMIINLVNSYESVLEDGDVSQDFWKNTSFRGWYTIVMSDAELDKHESDPEPKLPTVADFRGLVNKTSDNFSAISYVNALAALSAEVVREPWMDSLNVSDARQGFPEPFHIHDEGYTLEFANYIKNKLKMKTNLFYQSDNGLEWLIARVVGVELAMVGKTIKPEYEEKYNNASQNIKKEIYESYPDYYFDCKYEVVLYLTSWESFFDYDAQTSPMKFMEIPTGSAFCNIVKCYANKLYEQLSSAYGCFLASSESTRCLEHEPEEFYKKVIRILGNANFTAVSSCKNVIDFCKTEILPWAKLRARALYEQTIDDENASKFIQALSKRLNKNTGSLMLWYQNIISIDQADEDLRKEYNLTLAFLKGLATCACYVNNDPSLSCNSYCPNYIDLKPLDPMYSVYKYSFGKGDTVYICDDTHTELKAKVVNAQYVYITTTSYNEATFDSENNIQNTIMSADRVLRLTLDRKLPTYYCNGNDVSSLRCSKIC